MSENWDFYPCRVEDEPASIMVNLGIAAEAPIDAVTDCTWLHVSLKDPRPDGLSSAEEFDRLCEIGDALDAAVRGASTSLRYVGRCTCRGRRDFYTYAESGVVAESILSGMMAAFPEYEFDTGFHSDPQWRLYREFLYPTSRSMQLINNRRVLDVLEKQGDVNGTSRPIRHFAYFANEEHARSFSDSVAERNFEIVSRSADETSGSHAVIFERSDPTEFVAINNLTLELLDLAESREGRYDGWETQVQNPEAGTDAGDSTA